MNDRLKSFFALPIVAHEPLWFSGEPAPLSGTGLHGDDYLMATDETGVHWMRTLDGDARYKI